MGRNRDQHKRGGAGQQRHDQPRTNQISTTPSTAETMPATRSDISGLSNAVAAKRFAAPGKAAKNSPSTTSTSPIATMNWAMLRRRARDAQPLFRRDRWSGAAAAGSPGVAHLARGLGDTPQRSAHGADH